MTRKEEVLAALRTANGAWVDGTQLATAGVGGSEGLKRLREARAEGWPIEERRHPDPNRTVWQYRLPIGSVYRDGPNGALTERPDFKVRVPYPCGVCGANVAVSPTLSEDVVAGRCAITSACQKAGDKGMQSFRARA